MKKVNVIKEDLRLARMAGIIFKTLERAERLQDGNKDLEIVEAYCDGEFAGYLVEGREGYHF